MKRTIDMKHGILALFCMAALAGLAACDTDIVERAGGKQPDREALAEVGLQLHSATSSANRSIINLTEGTTAATDRIYCRLTQSVPAAVSVTAAADPSLVAAYNEQYGAALPPFPAENAVIAGGGDLTIAAGQRVSDKIQVTFKADGLAPGTYLLPISITSDAAACSAENRTLYYGVKVRGLDLGEYELDTDYLNVFYLNTSKYQPLLADRWLLTKQDGYTFETVWTRTYGNIVNLRLNQIGCDARSGRAVLVPSSDMRYVLDHADKYIRPLQDKGRKVCLCIEGDGKGLGFCNLTDAQIADFTAQVKAVLEAYGLDGVNLFDRNTGYGKEGMPAMNTTSYPKLIKALREAMPDKLLTLADYEEPTAYFWDTEATGGIEVGQYLDYAWSGYMSESEDIQLLDPWEVIDLTPEDAMDLGMMLPATDHPRKAIAGLDPEKFGYFAVPWYKSWQGSASPFLKEAQGFMNVAIWDMMGYCPNNMIVWGDIISNEQGAYEAAWNMIPGMVWGVIGDGAMDGDYSYSMDLTGLGQDIQYNYLAKDW